METDNVSDMPLDAILENCIFYILQMYEFSHSQDLYRAGCHTIGGERRWYQGRRRPRPIIGAL